MHRRFAATTPRKKRSRCCPTVQGLVLVNAMLALAALLGIAALTVDLGRLAVTTQRVQAVADATAIASAQELPDLARADRRRHDMLEASNRAERWSQLSIATDRDVTYYGPGETVPDHGRLRSDEMAVRVVVHAEPRHPFARLSRTGQRHLARSAIAKVRIHRDSHPTLFAGETAHWLNSLRVSGHKADVQGDAHSNSRMVINGAHNHFSAPLTYVSGIAVNGVQNEFDRGHGQADVAEYPVSHTWNDFTPWTAEVSSITVNRPGQRLEVGHLHVAGDVVINGSGFHAYNGIMMVEGAVTFNGSGHLLDHVTIIARGPISFSGTCRTLSPYVENLSLMSLYGGSDPAITFNGSRRHSHGTFFAPNGGITYNGVPGVRQYGSIIGKRILIDGEEYSISGSPSGVGGMRQVQLLL